MGKPSLTLLAIIAVSLVHAAIARGGTITVSNTDSGWYASNGLHSPGNPNYISGANTYRNFFLFDLSAVSGETITSAQLQLYTYAISGSGTYTTYDVVTPVPVLTAGGSASVATYADLGTGVSFGSISLMPAQSNQLILINLNAAAIAAIQAQASLTTMFAIGGEFISSGTAFAFSNFNSQNQLILQTAETQSVPDPGSSFMLLLVVAAFSVVVKLSRLVLA